MRRLESVLGERLEGISLEVAALAANDAFCILLLPRNVMNLSRSGRAPATSYQQIFNV